jgi:hypothetical protein
MDHPADARADPAFGDTIIGIRDKLRRFRSLPTRNSGLRNVYQLWVPDTDMSRALLDRHVAPKQKRPPRRVAVF